MRRAKLALVLALSGCASAPGPAPWLLLDDCPPVACTYGTNAELARCILDQRASLSTCNADKALLRKWAEGQ